MFYSGRFGGIFYTKFLNVALREMNIYKEVKYFLFEVAILTITMGLTTFILVPIIEGEKIELARPFLRLASSALIAFLCVGLMRLINHVIKKFKGK